MLAIAVNELKLVHLMLLDLKILKMISNGILDFTPGKASVY